MSHPEPKSDIWIIPRDYPADCMHYVVVQVSRHRHVVAEYRGGIHQSYGVLPHFEVVSAPMRFVDAELKAVELRESRVRQDVRSAPLTYVPDADRYADGADGD